MKTEQITFYHGTGDGSAAKIISDGIKTDYLQSIGAVEVAREVANYILDDLKVSGISAWEVERALSARLHAEAVDAAERDLWVRSLPYITGSGSEGRFGYGAFFITSSIERAYRYALCNPYRSEFMQSVAGGCAISRHLSADLHRKLDDLRGKYPECFSVMEAPPMPVVLEISGVHTQDLQTEEGTSSIEVDLELIKLFSDFGEDPQVSLRLTRLERSNIIAVHDLKYWDADRRPNIASVAGVKVDAQAWVSARA